MIECMDRSLKFGASDTSQIMQSWDTKTFHDWWLVKAGILENDNYQNKYIDAGNRFEVPILESLGIEGMQYGTRVCWCDCETLAVNLDGNTHDTIYEVKSVKLERAMDYPRKVPLGYWRQVQVQMLASGLRKSEIVPYGLIDSDYDNEYPAVFDIEAGRMFETPVDYDEKFIAKYVPRLLYLSDCLTRGRHPDVSELELFNGGN